MNVWFTETVVHDLGWTLVHFLWQGVAIALLLAVVLRRMRRSTANHRYLAGCAAMLLMAIAPLLTFRFMAEGEQLPAMAGPEYAIAPQPPVEIVPQPASLKPKIVVTAVPVASAVRFERVLPWLVAGWLAGVVGLSGRLLTGWWQVRRLKRRAVQMPGGPWPVRMAELAQRLGIARPLRLLESALVEVPTVIGWLRPVILLPASCLTGLTPGQLESILAHELAHIRRHDYLVNLLQSAVETLLFYHPAVWWVSRRVREERENCCDDLAVKVCGDRVGYARALATLEEMRLAPQLALAATGAPLLQRIRRLLGQSDRSAVRPAWPLAGVVVLLLAAILAVGMREHQAQANEATANSAAVLQAGNPPVETEPATNAGPRGITDRGDGELNDTLKPTKLKGLFSPGGQMPSITLKGVSIKGTSKAPQDLISKLNNIRVERVDYTNLSMLEVVDDLTERARKGDPEGRGINFIFIGPPGPESGAAQALQEKNWRDVKVNLHLTNASLAEVLDAITKKADTPIKYSFLAYAVVFSYRVAEPIELEVRTFRVDPTNFMQAIVRATATRFDVGATPVSTNTLAGQVDTDIYWTVGGPASNSNADIIQGLVRRFFTTRGVDLSTNAAGKAVIWNDRRGALTIRATPQDLILIEAALGTIMQPPPLVKLKVKFVEIAQSTNTRSTGWDWWSAGGYVLGSNPVGTIVAMPGPGTNSIPSVGNQSRTPALAHFTGILTEPQFRVVFSALEQRDGVEMLSAPEVTTETGRQTQIQTTGNRTINGTPGTNQSPFGPALDVIPYVSADGFSIHMTLIPSVTEFVGYDDPAPFVVKSQVAGGTPITAVLQLPNFRVRQVTTEVTVWDGQTVVIGGLLTDSITKAKNNVSLAGDLRYVGGLFRSESYEATKKYLLIFITPTIVNPDGTKYHSDDEMPWRK